MCFTSFLTLSLTESFTNNILQYAGYINHTIIICMNGLLQYIHTYAQAPALLLVMRHAVLEVKEISASESLRTASVMSTASC